MLEAWEMMLATAMITALVIGGWTAYVLGKIGASFTKALASTPHFIIALPLLALSPIIAPPSFFQFLRSFGFAAGFALVGLAFAATSVFSLIGWLIGGAVYRRRLRRATHASTPPPFFSVD